MFTRLAAGLAALCLSFTASAAKLEALPMPVAQELPVELVMSQQEVAIDVPNTASAVGGQFGLLGALIGSAVQNSQGKTAEKRVADLRNLLLDYRFNERMEPALRAALAREGFSPAAQIEVRATPWDAASATAAETLPRDVLVIVPRYAFTHTLDGLGVYLDVSYVHRERKKDGKGKQDIRFSRKYAYQYAVADLPTEEGAIDRRWLGMGRPAVEALIDHAVAQSAELLAYDFSAAGRAEAAAKVKNDAITFSGRTYNGRSVRSTADFVWVRTGPAKAQSLSGYESLNAARMTTAAAAQAASVPAPTAAPAAPAADGAGGR